MISMSIPQLLNSAITIVSVFVSMLVLSVPLTIVTLIMVALMIFLSAKATGASGKNFVAQQKNLGALNGYIEEMMTGQKVIKVFGHEPQLARKAIGYVPQAILFDQNFPASVLDIVLMGRVERHLFGGYRKSDRDIAMQRLHDVGMEASANSSFAASGNAFSSRKPSFPNHSFSYWTNRPPIWTKRTPSNCSNCSASSTNMSPFCSSPTTSRSSQKSSRMSSASTKPSICTAYKTCKA